MADSLSPTRNPFPYQGTFSVETRRGGKRRTPLTLNLPAVAEVGRLATVYLDRFGHGGVDRGQIVLVRGQHGSGKTHALAYAMNLVERECERHPSPSKVRSVLQLYTKVEEPDLVGVYRSLMSQLSAAQLRDLAQRFVGVMTGETVIAAARDDEHLGDEVLVRLREQPDLVDELLKEYVVDESDMFDRRDREVSRVTANSRDFRRAFSSLHREAIGDLAYRWITGQVLEPGELRKLGVDQVIDTPDMAKRGLQLLAAICSAAGTALILWIDQYEKLVLGPAGELVAESAGVLHSLVEAIPSQDSMLVLSGSNAAHDMLPLDLVQRFGPNIIEARGLRLAEAAALIALYLHPVTDPAIELGALAEDIEPFTADGLKLAHEVSRGNVRRLLQICSEGWRIARERTGVADADGVAAAAALVVGLPEEAPTPDAVAAKVRALARGQGLGAMPDDDAAVLLTLAGAPRIAVLVREYLHYYDESVGVGEQLDAVQGLRSRLPEVQVVAVPLGYVSAEVADVLGRAGVEVIPFLSFDFEQSFAEMLGRVRSSEPSMQPLASELAQLRQRLQELEDERRGQLQTVNVGNIRLGGVIEQTELASRWRAAQAEWLDERRRLEDRVSERRGKLSHADLEELERLRKDALLRQRRVDGSWLAVLVAAIALLVYGGGHDPYYNLWALVLMLAGATGLFVLVGAVVVNGSRRRTHPVSLVLQRPALRALAGPVTSVEELRRVAYQLHNRRYVELSYLLTDANPQVRFAATVSPRSEEDDRLLHALPGERCAIVRSAIAQRLGREQLVAEDALGMAIVSETPEAAYVLEGVLRDKRSPMGPFIEPNGHLPPPLQALAAIMSPREVGPATASLEAFGGVSGPQAHDVDRALQSGLAFRSRETLQRIPMDAVRRALRAVSPFEGGLAGLGELRHVDDIERAYIGLSQLVFFSERGLLVDPEWDD